MKSTLLVIIALLLLALPACNPATPEPTRVIEDLPVPPAPTQTDPAPLVCNTDYAHHELTGAYKQDKYNPQPVFTFAPTEFSAALNPLGIAAVCVPVGVDAPYLVQDWDAAQGTAQQGRMTIFSFDNWRAGWIVYATYDFAKGTEYDVFASAADYEAIKNTSAEGFERIMVGLCYGTCTVYRTYVYPFADHYVAITLNLGAYEYGNPVDQQVAKFTAGEYPTDLYVDVADFETLVRGLQFK